MVEGNGEHERQPGPNERLQLLQSVLSDQAQGLISFGHGAGRLAFTLNGGAVIALVTLAGYLSRDGGSQTGAMNFGGPLFMFVLGAFFGALTLGASYFFQLTRIKDTQDEIEKLIGEVQGAPREGTDCARNGWRKFMISVFIAAYGFFLSGSAWAVCVISSW